MSRLIAVVVGIDEFHDPAIPHLSCAVNDAESVLHALQSAQAESRFLNRALLAPNRLEDAVSPTKENILEAVRWAAREAYPEDTVMFYFAGHGGLYEGRPFLMPADARLGSEETVDAVRSLLLLDEIQSVFHAHPCRGRVMFIDCCQNPGDASKTHGQGRETAIPLVRGLAWRAGAGASVTLVDGFQQKPDGWSIVLSCSPGERSLEDPHWGHHGIFSHFLSAGLSGEADLDGDQMVSLAELMQYLAVRVPQQAAAVIEELKQRAREQAEERGEREILLPDQNSQTPTVIWSGPVMVRLTNKSQEGRAGFERTVLTRWPRFLYKNLPYDLPVQGMLRYGMAFLYFAATAITIGLALPGWGMGKVLGSAMAAASLSAFLWHAAYGLIGAATEKRWHVGGYFAPSILLAWHAFLFGALALIWTYTTEQGAEAALIDAGLALFAVISILVLFVFNPIQTTVNLAYLAQRNQRIVLRKAFMQLEERWVNADLPNVLAMVSAHPRLYQYLALFCSLGPIAHAAFVLANHALIAHTALLLLRDVFILLLIHWAVPWYGASYHAIRTQLLPDK